LAFLKRGGRAKVFFVCSILHNMMLDDGKIRDNSVHVSCDGPLEGDALFGREICQMSALLLPLHLRRPWLPCGTSVGMIWLHTASTWPEAAKRWCTA
jgi:hypothetical protein